MSSNIILIAQSVVSVFLIVVVLLQQKGTGLGGAFGGEGNVYRTRRGLEKTLFNFTVILAVTFAALAILAAFYVR